VEVVTEENLQSAAGEVGDGAVAEEAGNLGADAQSLKLQGGIDEAVLIRGAGLVVPNEETAIAVRILLAVLEATINLDLVVLLAVDGLRLDTLEVGRARKLGGNVHRNLARLIAGLRHKDLVVLRVRGPALAPGNVDGRSRRVVSGDVEAVTEGNRHCSGLLTQKVG